MAFTSPILGGNGVLIRREIRSPDYVPGVSGWILRRDGSVEINGLVARGTLQSSNFVPGVSGWELDNNGTAELNDVSVRGELQVNGDDGSYIEVTTIAGIPVVSLFPGDTGDAHSYSKATLFTQQNPGLGYQNAVILEGPMVDLLGTAKVIIDGARTNGTRPRIYFGPSSFASDIELRLDGDVFIDHDLTVSGPTTLADANITGDADIDGTLTFAGRPAPMTIVGIGTSGVNSGNIGTTETEILSTTNPVDFIANAAYQVEIVGGYQGSAIGSDPIWRAKKQNGAGTGQLACFFGRTPVTAATRTVPLNLVQYFTTGAAVPTSVRLSVVMASLAGTARMDGSFGGRTITVRYIGPNTLYPDANILT